MSAMMIICAAIALGGAVLTAILDDMKRAVFSLWACSIGLSGVYLALGAETLAVTQALLSTATSIVFLFHITLSGEYGGTSELPIKKRFISALPSLLLCSAFFVTLVIALKSATPRGEMVQDIRVAQSDLRSLASFIMREHAVSIELLGVTIFLTLIGASVVSRAERKDERK